MGRNIVWTETRTGHQGVPDMNCIGYGELTVRGCRKSCSTFFYVSIRWLSGGFSSYCTLFGSSACFRADILVLPESCCSATSDGCQTGAAKADMSANHVPLLATARVDGASPAVICTVAAHQKLAAC